MVINKSAIIAVEFHAIGKVKILGLTIRTKSKKRSREKPPAEARDDSVYWDECNAEETLSRYIDSRY